MTVSNWLPHGSSALVLAAACGGPGAEPPGAAEGAPTADVAFDSTRFDIVDEAAFRQLVSPDAEVVQLATGMMFLEGPAWWAEDGGYLVFSDIPANEMKRWDPDRGAQTFRAPSGPTNGNTVDAEGRLISAQQPLRARRPVRRADERRRGPGRPEGPPIQGVEPPSASGADPSGAVASSSLDPMGWSD